MRRFLIVAVLMTAGAALDGIEAYAQTATAVANGAKVRIQRNKFGEANELLGREIVNYPESAELHYLYGITLARVSPQDSASKAIGHLAIAGVGEALFAETTTLGFRWWPVSRETLPREEAVVESSLGRVAVKRVRRPDGRWETRPEYDSCREIARRLDLPVRDVLAALGAELNPEALVLRDE